MLVIAFFIISILYMMFLQHPAPFQLWLSILFVEIVMMYMHNMSTLSFHWHDVISVIYRQVSNGSRTKSQHLKDSRTVLWLSLPNPLKPDVKSRLKM